MDAKITKQRLTRLLSYDWVKIVAFAVAAILFWSLVFTMTATKITPAQQFTVFNYYSNRTFSDSFYSLYSAAFDGGVFSYEVIETNVNDLATSGEYASTLLEARVSTYEGDVMFIPNIGDADYMQTNGETGETEYTQTYMQTFLKGYFTQVYELDGENGYFTKMATYLNGYFGGDYKTGALDEAKAKNDFLARIEKNNDKRFKKDEEIEKGIEDEYARLEKYRAALIEFNSYLDSGLVEFTKVRVDYGSGENAGYREANYGLNISPEGSAAAEKMKNYVSYTVTETNADGQTVSKATALDMNVVFFKFEQEDGVEKSYEYESLLYVNYLIKNCLDA